MSTSKTLYEEAIADVRKLRELAEAQARDAVLQRVEPRIKALVEEQLFGESDEDEETTEEASTVSSVSGTNVAADVTYEVTEVSQPALASLANFVRPVTDDRFTADVYKIHEDVRRLVIADRATKLSEDFGSRIDSAISKLEDMYVYLRESYSGDDVKNLEMKLENSYGLANAVKESTMKMRDLLLNEESLTMKVNGLPDDVDLDGVTVDIVADEDDVDAEPGVEAAPSDGSTVPPAPAMPTAEGLEMSDDDVLEISESELRAELAKLAEMDGVKDFGDAKSKGHPQKEKTSDLDNIDEADVMYDEEKPVKAKPKSPQMEAVRQRLARAAKRLSEARGTNDEDLARTLYRGAIKAYRQTRGGMLAENKNVKVESRANAGTTRRLSEVEGKVRELTEQLTESNLLNAKLIHANKLLRVEGLTKAQRVLIVDRLDEARSLREVRLISESLSKVLTIAKAPATLAGPSRNPSGSASRPSSSGAAKPQNLSEGLETARWALLAGIK